MTVLSDGTVVPSILQVSQSDKETNVYKSLTNDSFIKVGQIVGVHYPKKNSVPYILYDVAIDTCFENKYNIMTLTNVKMLDLFGGKADFLRFTPRQKNNKKQYDYLDVGSRVVVCGVNGNLRDAIIIGGYPHPASDVEKDEGHNLKFEFNGVNFTINADGDLTVTRNSKTNDKGEIIGENGGATINLDKDGSITVSSSKGNKIILDDKNDNIEIQTNGQVNIKAEKEINTTSSGVYLGASDAQDKMILGNTYRDAENSMNQDLQQKFNMAYGFLMSAATALNTAGSSMSVPVSGAVLAGPQIVAVGQLLNQVATQFQQIASSIMQFEGKKEQYLSKKNFTE